VRVVLETPTFLRDVASSGMSQVEHDSIVRLFAKDPLRGDIIPGTGGARKVRIARARQRQIGRVPDHQLFRRR
jgi:hypothetical protein